MKITHWLLAFVSLFLLIQPVAAQDDIQFTEHTLRHDGLRRRYLLYVPPGYTAADAIPLVFLLHGGGGNPEIYEDITGMGQVAREEGFILVYPAGTGPLGNRNLLTWNAGHCCEHAMENNVDDVGFFREMVDQLTDAYTIDPDRIFIAGHSNGGMMTYRLAAEMSDVFAAAGIIEATIGGYPSPESTDLIIIPEPENPVSILHIHGMADTQVHYEGGPNDPDSPSRRNDLSVADSIGFWLEVNQCDSTPLHESDDDDMVFTDTYTCEATGTTVKLITIVDGGHSWPGGVAPRRQADTPSERVSATDELWAFFSEHPRQNP